jgi:hypothetical protein
MNDEEFKLLNEAIAIPKAEKLPVGRPIKPDSGSWTQPCSAPYLWRKLCEKYEISPSNAFQEGILMLLNNNENFPQTEYEERLVKGVFVDHKRKFAEIIAKIK